MSPTPQVFLLIFFHEDLGYIKENKKLNEHCMRQGMDLKLAMNVIRVIPTQPLHPN